jgi:alpha-ketoglutaric semialdehyde dehydrogenase
MEIPSLILNLIDGEQRAPQAAERTKKYDPHTGKVLTELAGCGPQDVESAVASARRAWPGWSELTPVRRGQILGDVVGLMKKKRAELERIIAVETGKPPQDAAGEVNAAILQGEFFAGEGMRLYSRALTSGMPGKHSHTVRQPLGVAALIVPANTPIANIAWKVFPALLCGNTAVLKASEDAPYTGLYFGLLAQEAGLPAGVLNVLQGTAEQAGKPLVVHNDISLISFTGSTAAGRSIGEAAGRRLAKVSLELGGKNPLIVCDDADLDHAVKWAALSAFSNAGQRCAAASRIIVMDGIYDAFLVKFKVRATALKVGVTAGCDLGPVINERSLQNLVREVSDAKARGAVIECGGHRLEGAEYSGGYYFAPTIVTGVTPGDTLSRKELFGPVVCVYRVGSFDEALTLANDTEYGLTSAVHTRDINRALKFGRTIRAGVANINLGTFGSEPHMPFGGLGLSGNGTREPGTEALDVYSELKNISYLEF